MGLFKKKEVINSLFSLHEMVNFRYRNELYFGYIYHIKKKDNIIYYDIQIGGQCPGIIKDIEESLIKKRPK